MSAALIGSCIKRKMGGCYHSSKEYKKIGDMESLG